MGGCCETDQEENNVNMRDNKNKRQQAVGAAGFQFDDSSLKSISKLSLLRYKA